MRFIIGLPLHYQILIALILGTVLGLLINPGAVTLDDVAVTVESENATPIVVTTEDEDGQTIRRETFPTEADFAERYPELVKLWREIHEESLRVEVTDRRIFIAEDDKGISISYQRRLNGRRTVVTTDRAAHFEELSSRYPHWTELYEEHGGGVARQIAVVAKSVGDIFLRLLKMITIPLIVFSLVTGISGLGETSQFGSMFGKTILYYVSTSLLAITTGLLIVNVIRPGVGAEIPGGGEAVTAPQQETLGGIFLGLIDKMIPENPVESLAQSEFLAIITFSILFGIFIIQTGGAAAEFLKKFFESGFQVMMNLTMAIIALAPIGVFAFMLYATASQGIDIFKTLGWYMLSVFLALVVHACVVLPLILYFVAKRSPWQYFQALSPALMTAFSTASSNATLPLTLTSVEKRAGVSNRVGSFVLPLGATINMDGTALYEVVAVLFIAQATPGFAMTFESQLIVAITALLASVGAAGIPHAGLVMMAIVLQAVGLPLEAQGIIIAVDRVLDMCRTAVNVWSDSCGCAVLARFHNSNDSPS